MRHKRVLGSVAILLRCSDVYRLPRCRTMELLSGLRKMTPAHVAVGVAIGFVLAPVIAVRRRRCCARALARASLLRAQAVLALLVPLIAVLAVLAAALVAYAVFKLKANASDWILFKGIAKPRVQQILAAKRNHTTDVYWYQAFDKQPRGKPFIVDADSDTVATWDDVERVSNQVGNWAVGQSWPVGTPVALLMPNRAEFVAIWLGNAKVGLVTALLNTNLRKLALLHCIKSGECKALIYDVELVDAVKEILAELKELGVALFAFDGDQASANSVGATLLRPELARSSSLAVRAEHRAGTRGALYNEPVFYIYTSGTTGLPKAARITHHRFRLIGSVFGSLFASASDRLYCPLPLYHSAGGMIGVGSAFQSGCTVVLRKKFSASGFVKDCVK